jgi:hypothetical protein
MAIIKVGEDVIEATTTHPFWVLSGEALEGRPAPRVRDGGNEPSMEAGRWIPAGELRDGDVLLAHEGRIITVTSVEVAEKKVHIHNLLVDRNNNYAVGNAGVLVNNM